MFIALYLLGNVLVGGAFASVHDCWDQEKLSRMNFNQNSKHGDPGLSQFAKMLKCLSMQQGGQIGDDNLNTQWSQFANFAGGQFNPVWSNNDNDNWQGPPNNPRDRNWGEMPKPGVHPDDWNNRNNWDSRRRGPEAIPPPSQPPTRDFDRDRVRGGSQPDARNEGDRNWGKDREARRRDREQRRREREQEKRRRLKNEQYPQTETPPRYEQHQPGWGTNQPGPPDMINIPDTGNPSARDLPPVLNQEEAASRKYGYIIMAMSVIVLAVLMVVTIFCCNNSNSTMSQAANQQLPVNQYDTYSIYSFKGGQNQAGPVADTLRSTGTLGGMSFAHTETMKSRGSPQYRVSDIDPEYARRFKDSHY